MYRFIFILLAGILAGFVLLHIPLENTFLSGIMPITDTIGILSILFFSLYLIYMGVKAVFKN